MNFIITEAGRNIALVSLGIVSLSTIVRYFTVDKEKVRASRERVKEHQQKLKEAQKKGDTKRAQKHQQDLMAETMESMKHNMKPMVFTLIPILLIFGWLRGNYGEYGMLYDVTVEDRLPDAGISEISASDDGVVIPESRTIRWHLGNVSGGKKGSLSAKALTGASPQTLKSDSALSFSYFTADNVSHSFEGEGSDGLFTVSRSDYGSSGEYVEYRLNYVNDRFIVKIGSYTMGWFGWYIIISFSSSIILNKIFKLN